MELLDHAATSDSPQEDAHDVAFQFAQRNEDGLPVR